MNLYRGILKITTVFVVIFLLASCDDDFSNIGGEIIENPSGVQLREYDINAYTVDLKSIQTNTPNPKLLGVYNHPVFGEKSASVLSQLRLGTTSPEFPEGAILDSVVLNLPYFSREDVDDNGDPIFELDSVYGDGGFRLSIRESRYFLNDLDPSEDFERAQRYYSDQQSLFEQFLTEDSIYVNENFVPSTDRIRFIGENDEGEADTTYSAPALRVHLNRNYFQQKIVDMEGSAELSSASNFYDYFRGLMFKAEPIANEGSMALFNFTGADAGINIYYSYLQETTDDDGETVEETFVDSLGIDFGANIVNTFEGEYPEQIQQNIASGSENLYLDGGEGTLGVVELFDQEDLADLRSQNILINEANLELYLNTDLMNGANAPSRLYLYDLSNNAVLIDYSLDPSANQNDPLNSRTIFSSLPETDESTGETKYTLRLTQHVINLLENDSTGVRLGVSVTSNIQQTTNVAVRESMPDIPGEDDVEVAPAASTITPEGAVFYGSGSSNENRRLKLRVYYTDTDL
ncbi:DUF4270 domain-containing protein [Zunongwangia sp. SCSIO 43204]|uniref:DUF4270 domain-containing protein n=1 Tax=Zunongwangia sp. SCSIO 43204 TaxID=2779359 RepID=UPI001CA96C66|nr:DUF4270 domain-containing protein [Zunongwangia sp. SCSIO 43204]UAB85515.1 DUF4270 domain-containing protein [Zunongwangia sp. SCSIO 43204]